MTMKSVNRNIPVAAPVFSEDEAQAVYEVIRSGWVTSGPKVAEFEQNFADFAGVKHAIAMSNGTATLHAALVAIGVGPGDEVIVPTLTYISTANVVMYQGATLVLCECDPDTYNVRTEDLEKVVTKRTKAVIAVDINGLPVDFQSISKFCEKRNIHLIADSAESLGAIYKGQTIGSQALIHSFSFFGNKNVTTAEGGMLTTNDSEIAKTLKILRNQGQTARYYHTHLGFNYRMTELQAAIGIVQLNTLGERLKSKERIVAEYVKSFETSPLISNPVVPNYVDRHAWYMFAPNFAENINRDEVVKNLARKGIETRCSFPPVHIQPYYVERFGYSEADFPESMRAWKRLINLPISPNLSDEDLKFVIESTLSAVEANQSL